MKGKFSKIFSVILAACVSVSLFPATVFSGASDPVRVSGPDSGTIQTFSTVSAAVEAANRMERATIEILGDVNTESKDLTVTSDITIIGSACKPVITHYGIDVEDGGRLTLGSGSVSDTLTIEGGVAVKDGKSGTVIINDGVEIISNGGAALYLRGAGARAVINGGRLEGYNTIRLELNARIDSISGGVFNGAQSTMEMSGEHGKPGTGPTIGVISGGTFTKTVMESNNTSGSNAYSRSAFHVDNYSHIDKITGGSFIGGRYAGMLVIRGSSIGEISGGSFISEHGYGNGALTVFSDDGVETKVDVISGGEFIGVNDYEPNNMVGIGLWLAHTGNARIGSITGGVFSGYRALSTEPKTTITEITGGVFNGVSCGIFNAGDIGNIGGTADIYGKSTGIWDWYNSTIGEISGGSITTGPANNAITNYGKIKLISGGTIIGGWGAISNSSGGAIGFEKITGGVFWSKTNNLFINFSDNPDIQLEPGLTADIGAGRYCAGNGKMFSVADRVIMPAGYHMSIKTTPAEGIKNGDKDVLFRYLKKNASLIYDVNGGIAGSGPDTEALLPPEKDRPLNAAVTPSHEDEGGNPVLFIGWTIENDENISGNIYGINDILPKTSTKTDVEDDDITARAIWAYDSNRNGIPDYTEDAFTLVYDANGGDEGSCPADESGLLPENGHPLNCEVIPTHGTTNNHTVTFIGWTAARNDKIIAKDGVAPECLDSVDIVDGNVTVYAAWRYGEEIPTEPDEKPDVTDDKPDEKTDVTDDEPEDTPDNADDETTDGPGDETQEPVTDPKDGNTGNTSKDPGPGGSVKPNPKPDDNGKTQEITPPLDKPQDIPQDHILLPNGSGGYWEIDKNGKIIGVWTFDEEQGAWIFDDGIPSAGLLFTDDHIWYIRGYLDNTIRPDYNISRAEVAMVFYRLLNPELRINIANSVFDDVSLDDWYGEAINTLAYYGFVCGYPGGVFRPDQPITRSEIAAVVSRFEKLARTGNNPYTDLDADNWAYHYILSATEKGWFMGDAGGLFRPDENNTRAEFVAIVNRVLKRRLLFEDIPGGVHKFDDLGETHWAYSEIIESIYEHSQVRKGDGIYETWTDITGTGLDAAYNQ